jgi:hypothetical protein
MTNAMESHFESILSAVRECDRANLPVLIGALEQAKAEAWGRLSTPAVQVPQETKARQERLRTPEEAASIAQVPVRRLYGWALRIEGDASAAPFLLAGSSLRSPRETAQTRPSTSHWT